MFGKLQKFFDGMKFREIDRRKLVLRQWPYNEIVFKIRGNEKTRERYAVVEFGGESGFNMDAEDLLALIAVAQANHSQMR
jgi:hypothetical protein